MNKQKHKIEKEKELLALVVADPQNLDEMFGKISLDMFTDEHQAIFDALFKLELLNSYDAVWQLKKMNYTGVSEILKLSTSLPPDITGRIKEFFDICDSIKADQFLTDALEESQNSLLGLDTLVGLKKNVDSELDKYSRFQKPLSFNDSLEGIIQRVENRTKQSDSIKTVSFPSFNTATGGLNEGNLVGIAGAFKNGKTTFGLNLVLDIANQNIPTAIFSLEMTKAEIEEKILSYKTGIPCEKIRNPQRLSDDEKLTIAHFYGSKRNFNERLFVFDKSFTISEIESRVKELKRQENLKIVLIDYLGLIKSSAKNSESREREISQLSNSLKILAKETDTIVFVLSQLNRSGIKEASSVNLAESIALARESDFLFTIYKPTLSGLEGIMKKDKEKITFNENHFLVKLDSSRHTTGGKEFLLSLSECGMMKETQTQYDNSYLEQISDSLVI
jgi:replicative DNA helicase